VERVVQAVGELLWHVALASPPPPSLVPLPGTTWRAGPGASTLLRWFAVLLVVLATYTLARSVASL
jgi:hypothetical protein